MTKIREGSPAAHGRDKYPIFHRNRFLTGAFDEELQSKDLTWTNASGIEMRPEDWGDEAMLVHFTLPAASGGGWKLVIDTNVTVQIQGFEGSAGDQYGVTARSLAMFALLPA
jgi:isoamylase